MLLVVGRHLPYFPLLGRVGWCGVDLFFVLSGYLISGLLFREYVNSGRINIGRFLLRRGLKIWPPLYVFLTVMLIFLSYLKAWSDLAAAALFYANYHIARYGLGHTWSLAVEEHFYIGLPLLLLLLIRWQKVHWIPALYLTLFLGCFILRCQFPENAWYGTQYRIDSLFAGVTLCYLRYFRPARFALIGRKRNLVLAAVLLSAMFLQDAQIQTFGFSCMAVGFVIVLAWAVQRPRNSWLAPLAWVGTYSYSIYLWQQPFSGPYHSHPSLLRFVMFVMCIIGLGVLTAKAVEFPVLRLRDRLFPNEVASCPLALN